MFAPLVVYMDIVHILYALLGREIAILGKPAEPSVVYYLFPHLIPSSLSGKLIFLRSNSREARSTNLKFSLDFFWGVGFVFQCAGVFLK